MSLVKPGYFGRWQSKRDYLQRQSLDKRADLEESIRKQAYWQQFNVPHKRVFMPIIADDWSWQTDSMFYPLHGKLRAVFCAIEMTRRIGFVRVYKGASPTATQCREFLKELQEEYEVRFIGADLGSEYDNKTVKEWAKLNDIELRFYEKGALRNKALVERFNATVRRLLNWWTYNHSSSWVTALPKLIDQMYNRRVHSTIKMAPLDVSDADALRIREAAYNKGRAYRDLLNGFTNGSQVRLFWKVDPDIPEAQKAFRKLGPVWSKKLYTVLAVDGYKVKLEGLPKKYSVSDLQLVTGAEGEQVPGVPEVRRLKKAKRAAELAEIDATVPARELAAIQKQGRDLRERTAKKPEPAKAKPKKAVQLNEELAPVQEGEDEAEKVLGYEFRTGRKGAGARWGLWFQIEYSSGQVKWERVNGFLVPAYEILGNKRKKQVGLNVLAPVGAYWDKQRKKDARLNEIWTTEL